jgi:hypothetical protein
MHQNPTIGSQVRISTIRFGQNNVYEGIVVPSNRSFTFAVRTRNERHPISEFEANDPAVLQIEILKGVKSDARVFKVLVKSKRKTYHVSVLNKSFNCNCTGFSYRKTCSHVTGVKNFLKEKAHA